MTQTQLQAVVAAVPAGLPTIERRELFLIVLERQVAGRSGAVWKAESVQNFQRQRFIPRETVEEVIHILARSWIGRGVRRATRDSPRSSGGWKQVVPVWKINTGIVFSNPTINRFVKGLC